MIAAVSNATAVTFWREGVESAAKMNDEPKSKELAFRSANAKFTWMLDHNGKLASNTTPSFMMHQE